MDLMPHSIMNFFMGKLSLFALKAGWGLFVSNSAVLEDTKVGKKVLC